MLEAHRKQGYTKPTLKSITFNKEEKVLEDKFVYGPQHCTSPSPGQCIVEEPATYSHLHPHI